MKDYFNLGCDLRFSPGDGLHLWLLSEIVYLTWLDTATLKTVEIQTEYLDYFPRNIQSIGLSLICMWATLTIQGIEILSKPGSEIILTFGLLTSYLFWWQFAPVTVERSCLPNLVGDGTVENSWGANWITILFFDEYTILWFVFDLCGNMHWRNKEERC